MIIPCIDLMGGKVVQLVQGREKALDGGTPDEMLRQFASFPVIQVIDLDAAIGSGENSGQVEWLTARALCRVGGGVRSRDRFFRLREQGADRVIVGTAAFSGGGVNREFLQTLDQAAAIVALDTKEGRIVVKGWRESLDLTAEQVIRELEPYCAGFLCTCVDKEGMMQGTDLAWFERLRAATAREITAAGGITTLDEIRALAAMDIHAALGMAIYSGRLPLDEVAALERELSR
jgi:phosphoribosylformimino-5-aminoimidazole carboxamide ribotide isomerase